jgi:polyphosphate kinase
VYLSSADWMPRNLDRRAELMFPVKDEKCRQAVINVLTLQWNDTEKCRHCTSEGVYHLSQRFADGLNAQETLLADVEGVFAGTVPLAPADTQEA